MTDINGPVTKLCEPFGGRIDRLGFTRIDLVTFHRISMFDHNYEYRARQ